jgi:tRNA nucleotidyltransferase (CCA-adding enzyme)
MLNPASGTREEVQVSIPRKDSRVGAGHTDFVTTLIPDLDPQTAASRRDFEFNGMMYDCRDECYLDPVDGYGALAERRLRHIGPAFWEDFPIRGWRAFKFAGRHDLTASNDLVVELLRARQATMFSAAVRRNIWKEWEDWAAWSVVPSRGLNLLWRAGWLRQMRRYPATAPLWYMVGCAQDPVWHPEGTRSIR